MEIASVGASDCFSTRWPSATGRFGAFAGGPNPCNDGQAWGEALRSSRFRPPRVAPVVSGWLKGLWWDC